MVTKLSSTRVSDLKGALAIEVLERRARNQRNGEIVVELPYVSANVYRAAKDFMNRVAPDDRFRLQGRDGTHASSDGRAPKLRERGKGKASSTVTTAPLELFTDMRQWLLKYLLLYAPERDGSQSLRALAAATETSLTTAQGFVEVFSELGHIVKDHDGYRVVRREELMRRWLASMDVTAEWRIPVRAHYGGVSQLLARLEQRNRLSLKRESRTVSAALGGFAACKARGVLHVVEPGPPEIHVDGDGMAEVFTHAVRCEKRDAQALIVPSAPFAASIFRPIRHTKPDEANLQPVDLIQAALDVWSQPLGGKEQARHIIDHVLKWSDGDQARVR